MTTDQISIQEMNAFRYRTSTGENGETLYHMPIEIRSQADLDNYGITLSDCKTIHFGGTNHRIVYFFLTANRALAEEQWRYLNRKHMSLVAKTRCMVPGKRKPLKRCHPSNACSRCPYGKSTADKQLNIISWEKLTEAIEKIPEEMIARDFISDTAENRMLVEELQEELDRKNPRWMRVLRKYYIENHTLQEIGDESGISAVAVLKRVNRALRLARDFLGKD